VRDGTNTCYAQLRTALRALLGISLTLTLSSPNREEVEKVAEGVVGVFGDEVEEGVLINVTFDGVVLPPRSGSENSESSPSSSPNKDDLEAVDGVVVSIVSVVVVGTSSVS